MSAVRCGGSGGGRHEPARDAVSAGVPGCCRGRVARVRGPRAGRPAAAAGDVGDIPGRLGAIAAGVCREAHAPWSETRLAGHPDRAWPLLRHRTEAAGWRAVANADGADAARRAAGAGRAGGCIPATGGCRDADRRLSVGGRGARAAARLGIAAAEREGCSMTQMQDAFAKAGYGDAEEWPSDRLRKIAQDAMIAHADNTFAAQRAIFEKCCPGNSLARALFLPWFREATAALLAEERRLLKAAQHSMLNERQQSAFKVIALTEQRAE